MPQVAIEYSRALAPGFDPRALAAKVHARLVEHAGAEIRACKTRLLPLDEVVIGAGGTDEAMAHVAIGILSGRTAGQKSALADAVLADLEAAVGVPAGLTVQLTVEIRDMDRESYGKRLAGSAA